MATHRHPETMHSSEKHPSESCLSSECKECVQGTALPCCSSLPPPFRVSGSLLSLISSAHAAVFRPLEFFVAWQGVLTIAYSGFPPSISELKKKLAHETLGIVKENPGSMWPKASLACLKDFKRLSMMQLMQLKQICREETCHLVMCSPVIVDSLSLVVYANCCLEDILLSTEVPLQSPVDKAEPSADQAAYVQKVLGAFDNENLEEYYFHASKDGNRSAHYRTSKAGVTLVHFLAMLPAALMSFKAKVEAALPGLYDWFAEESIHITIRALS